MLLHAMRNGRSELAGMRWTRCLQQQEVARMTGLRQSVISAAERGRALSLKTAEALAGVYDVSIDAVVEAYRKGVA